MIDPAPTDGAQLRTDAREELGREVARLQTIIDTVPSFLWTSLPDGSKEYLNKRWYEYTGLSLEQGQGARLGSRRAPRRSRPASSGMGRPDGIPPRRGTGDADPEI